MNRVHGFYLVIFAGTICRIMSRKCAVQNNMSIGIVQVLVKKASVQDFSPELFSCPVLQFVQDWSLLRRWNLIAWSWMQVWSMQGFHFLDASGQKDVILQFSLCWLHLPLTQIVEINIFAFLLAGKKNLSLLLGTFFWVFPFDPRFGITTVI